MSIRVPSASWRDGRGRDIQVESLDRPSGEDAGVTVTLADFLPAPPQTLDDEPWQTALTSTLDQILAEMSPDEQAYACEHYQLSVAEARRSAQAIATQSRSSVRHRVPRR